MDDFDAELGHELWVDHGDGISVLAHALLNSFAVMAGRAATLRESWEQLDAGKRSIWLGEIERVAIQSASLMRHLAVGVPVGVAPNLAR